MSISFPVCAGDITEDGLGNLRCSTGWDSEQVDLSLNQLTTEEIGEITVAVATLFAVAFVFRQIRRFMDSSTSGRNG